MTTHDSHGPASLGVIYAALGVALFVVGGMVLDDAYSDGLKLVGFISVGWGLVGIIAGGVALGSSKSG